MALKKSEKRLLTIFGVALFVVGTFLAEGIFAQRKTAAKNGIDTHKEKIAEYTALLRDEEEMTFRREWLERRQPRFVSEEAAATDVENHIKSCAQQAGVEVDSLKPTEPISESHYIQIAHNVNVSGPSGAVTQFASLLQQTDGFFAVPSITFTTDRKDPTLLRCACVVARWYSTQPAASSAAPTGESFAAANGN